MIRVLKFGGSSVANATNLQKVIQIIQSYNGDAQTIVVVSALGGITDALIKAATEASQTNDVYKTTLVEIEAKHLDTVKNLIGITQQSGVLSMVKKHCNDIEDICNGVFLLGELSLRTKDKIMSFGELLSSKILSAALTDKAITHQWVDSRQLISTNSNYGKAVVDTNRTNTNIEAYLTKQVAPLYIAPGFIAADQLGIATTLGRGGSDYTAAIYAAACNALVLEIWTDVSGMMTADPRLANNVKVIPRISYQEAMELSHFGAKVIYPPTIQPVMAKKIPTWIKNTFVPQDEGTLIEVDNGNTSNTITGITSIKNIALLNIEGSGMIGIPGISKRLFEALASNNVNVILITQGSSEHSICVGVDALAANTAKFAIDNAFDNEIAQGAVDPIRIEHDLAVLALVGDNMKSHAGVSGRMFSTLGRNGINIRAIAQGSSEKNISAVILEADVKKAINVLHETFFETTYKQVNLFIAGIGNVGKKLISQIIQQQQYLKAQLHIQLNVVGLANSKKMCIHEDGIALDQYEQLLSQGETSNITLFAKKAIDKNLRNSVFVDVTANEEVATCYEEVLKKSISIVACNKVAASSAYSNYAQLKNTARNYNCKFLFETNVGAGLPIIGTLNDLKSTGDVIHKIEAVLSGTLNFVFNNYDGTKSFSAVVAQAQAEGYTEPDPRLDLSGKDVMRKIMILAREAGSHIEMDDIANESFMPASCMRGSVADFYKAMEKEEAHFKKIFDESYSKQCKLKFVASFDNGKANVGLQHIDTQHDFYHLYGKDNIVAFYTSRYANQPLVVKGAGAGAEVTASGIFADIMRTVSE
jgi:bifunctional aspartokinase / homoserine dehydrogenase 1